MFNTHSVCPLSSRKIKDSVYKVVIDQFDAKEFNQNDAGWIRNDISQLSRATSQAQYDAIMKRLVELQQQGGIPADMSIEDAISQIKPRYAQSPNEIEQFIAYTNSGVMSKLTEAYNKALNDEPISDKKVDVQPVVDSPEVSK